MKVKVAQKRVKQSSSIQDVQKKESYWKPCQGRVTVKNSEKPLGGWFSRFEGPTNVHIEMGTNFMSKLFKSLSKELGSDRSTTSTYHSQGTAIIERTK